MDIKYKIWLEKEDEVVFGPGRAELFLAIEEYKSLQAAAKKLGMSYRAAWGRLRASEKRLGVRLLDMGNGNALTLTPTARNLLKKFRCLENETQALLQKAVGEFSDILREDELQEDEKL